MTLTAEVKWFHPQKDFMMYLRDGSHWQVEKLNRTHDIFGSRYSKYFYLNNSAILNEISILLLDSPVHNWELDPTSVMVFLFILVHSMRWHMCSMYNKTTSKKWKQKGQSHMGKLKCHHTKYIHSRCLPTMT